MIGNDFRMIVFVCTILWMIVFEHNRICKVQNQEPVKAGNCKTYTFPYQLFDIVSGAFLWVCLLIVIPTVWGKLDSSAALSMEPKLLTEEPRAQTLIKLVGNPHVLCFLSHLLIFSSSHLSFFLTKAPLSQIFSKHSTWFCTHISSVHIIIFIIRIMSTTGTCRF